MHTRTLHYTYCKSESILIKTLKIVWCGGGDFNLKFPTKSETDLFWISKKNEKSVLNQVFGKTKNSGIQTISYLMVW